MLERSTHLSEGTRRRFAYGAADHRDHRAGYLRLYPYEPDLDHRRSDLPFANAVRTRSAAGDRCREVGLAGGRSGPAAGLPRRGGDLKLAYSQFEELESFAKFGTRLDDATRKTIDHGQRIRVCLNQPESQPWSVVEQICVLLALTSGLFDPVPIEKVKDAEGALRRLPKRFRPTLRRGSLRRTS